MVTVPLTAIIVGLWYGWDRHTARIARLVDIGADEGRAEAAEWAEYARLEARIMRNIRRRTGINVADGTLPNPPTRVGGALRERIKRYINAVFRRG